MEEEGNMQCMQALKLSVTALLAFVGITATQPDANDPILVKIDSGVVRGAAAGGVISSFIASITALSLASIGDVSR
jgi:hypothetical protein